MPSRHALVIAAFLLLACGPTMAWGQVQPAPDPDSVVARDTVPSSDSAAARARRAALTPGGGFPVADFGFGSMNISVYALARYLNQVNVAQRYDDHLDREREVDPRHDIQFHRVMIHVLGWVFLPKLTYVATVWTVNSTEQIRLIGNLTYKFDEKFNLAIGVNGMPGTRSLLNSHPFWLAPDRVMADEYFRPGFTQGVWAFGELPGRVNYSVMYGNNISALGVSATEETREMATGASVWWLPTTGEFGPRGGYGDFEWHDTLAVRVGTSFTRSREDRASQIAQPSPDNTQIRISDGQLLFQNGALAPGVTMQKATYAMSAADLGFKYKGIFVQGELYHRWLYDFDADGPLPQSSLYDRGFYVAGAFFPVKHRLEAYAGTSQIDGSFNRSWEILGGLNWHPSASRYFRVNLNLLHVHRSPVGSSFGYYLAGLHGGVVSLASSIYF